MVPPPGSGGSTVVPPSLQACAASHAVDPGPAPMRLLSHEQYLNTVRDLVGSVPGLDGIFTGNGNASEFGLIAADVGQVDLETFQKGADLVAAAVVGNTTLLNTLAACGPTADKRTCARTFVEAFGARLYRAPLSDAADIDRHLQVFDVGVTTSYAHGIELLLRAMLQAPRFLYRVEIGTAEKIGAGAIKLSGYEIASRLSYTVWNTLPDDKLVAAAASGALGTKDGVAAQLATMLKDARGQTLMRRFLEGWIHLDDVNGLVKDQAKFPQWTDGSTVKASLIGQARAFFDDILGPKEGKVAAMLTSPTVFANKDLGGYYGVSGGADFQAVQPTGGATSGLLTLPALMATLAKQDESSAIYRGRFVREQVLCQQLPPPPANVPKPPDVQPGVSGRERFRQHETDMACSGCHQMIDPLGLGFENFDAVGRYRTMDNGVPVDATGEVIGTADSDGKFNGVVELGQKLAGSQQVQECLSRQWFRFMLSRFEQDVDACSMGEIASKFRAAGGSLNALPQALIGSDAFLYRRPLDSQVSP